MSQPPLVTAVILNWNGLPDTRECLESLRRVTYGNLRTIVVDNGSEGDEAGQLAREFGAYIEVIRNPENLGFAGGANVGIRRALEIGADYVLLLNNDVTVAPDFLEAMLETAQRRPRAAAVCPKAYFKDGPDVIYSTGGTVSLWTGTARQIGRGEKDHGQFEREEPRDYADGLCMLIPAEAIRRIGLLDEEYFAYWEETDWCIRGREAGLRCYYAPAARVWHKAERSQSPDDAYHYLYRRNAILFVRKRGGPYHLVTALLAYAFWYAPRYFIRHPGKIGRAPAEVRAVLWHTRNEPRRRPLV